VFCLAFWSSATLWALYAISEWARVAPLALLGLDDD